MTARLERRLGVFSATTLIVGSMIGSGIFIAPSIMAGLVGAPGVYLGLWLVGGVLTLLGALCYAELCAMMPRAGGQYVFLREAFGPRVGFLYGWTVLVVIQTGFNAAVAIAFAKFLGGVGLSVGEQDIVISAGGFAVSRAQLVAVLVITALTWVNCRGVAMGAFVQNLFTVLKVCAIAVLVAIGFGSGAGSFSNFTPLFRETVGPSAGTMTFLAAAGVAMSKALFAYDAWNTVSFAAEEIREPHRNLPRALLLGTVVTTLTYLAACALYLYVLPLGAMALVHENRVGMEVGRVLLGDFGERAIAIAILVSTFGCLNGLILGGARVFFAMARDRLFFSAAGRLSGEHRVPRHALVIQAVWSAVLALSGSYSALLTYVTFASLVFNALTVLALVVLRRSQPEATRPYRTWGYPVTPIVYLAGSVFFIVYIFVGDPRDALVGIALVLLGLPVFAVLRRRYVNA